MDMKINAEKIIRERKIRAWSQQHLADVCAVSLRTIQRVENNGAGSLETIKAIASCFELDVANLLALSVESPINQSTHKPKVEIIDKKRSSISKTNIVWSFIFTLLSSVFLIVPINAAPNVTIHSETISTNPDKGYSIYSKNVVIFLPRSMRYKVLMESQNGGDSSSSSSEYIRIYLESSLISFDKGSIETSEVGTKITTDYAKVSKLK